MSRPTTSYDGKRPNPGSDQAREAGCICPVMDNNHGKWAPWPPDGWWTRPDCPMHGPKPTVERWQT